MLQRLSFRDSLPMEQPPPHKSCLPENSMKIAPRIAGIFHSLCTSETTFCLATFATGTAGQRTPNRTDGAVWIKAQYRWATIA